MPKQNITEDAAPVALVEAVHDLGQRIRLARQRRRLRQVDLAAKAGITTRTLRRLEGGELGTGIGGYAAVLWALGLLNDLVAVADPDADLVGRTLESARRGERVRPGAGLDDDF
jgi:transcriptional regulator with XRE-family HTH domain